MSTQPDNYRYSCKKLWWLNDKLNVIITKLTNNSQCIIRRTCFMIKMTKYKLKLADGQQWKQILINNREKSTISMLQMELFSSILLCGIVAMLLFGAKICLLVRAFVCTQLDITLERCYSMKNTKIQIHCRIYKYHEIFLANQSDCSYAVIIFWHFIFWHSPSYKIKGWWLIMKQYVIIS